MYTYLKESNNKRISCFYVRHLIKREPLNRFTNMMQTCMSWKDILPLMFLKKEDCKCIRVCVPRTLL